MPIFDQGYQHWSGRLSGHAWRWFAIARHGVRVGLQRRIFRFVLSLSFIPALGLAFALCLWSMVERNSSYVAPIVQFLVNVQILNPAVVADPRHYRVEMWTICYNLFLSLELTISMILVVLVGPDLISQDRRFNALTLYLSRPLRRIDYLAGKLGVIAAFLAFVIIVPCLVAYALGLLFSLDWTIIRDTYRLLLATIAYGLVIIFSAGTLMLALSSLSRNSRYVALFWMGIWIISGIVSTILQTADNAQRQRAHFRRVAAIQPQMPMRQRPAERPGERSRDRTGDRRRQQQQAMLAQQAVLRQQQEGAVDDFQTAQAEAAKTDWRPLVSYTANLSRVGGQLLGTEACLRTLGELEPNWRRRQFFGRYGGPQYPWYWSAGVLAGLFGLSACILSLSVRSLDRLK